MFHLLADWLGVIAAFGTGIMFGLLGLLPLYLIRRAHKTGSISWSTGGGRQGRSFCANREDNPDLFRKGIRHYEILAIMMLGPSLASFCLAAYLTVWG